ncbi:hypothetical protein [Carboxylicivirga sp. N1Y90]|uniref:hypothetical protein n=1 Tax=Carboxylicivirga fragile TaxID=3417571 RepID=UPI003D34321D|nr:hypothetical protein [Marinilabiliaceae bacterium N1Y90]
MEHNECFSLLNEQLKDISKVEIRSLSLAVLPRLMNVLHINQNHCNECKRFTKEGEVFVHDISPLFGNDVRAKRSFENWVTTSQQHLTNVHQQQTKGKLSASYAAIGMFLGIIIASAYTWLSGGENYIGMAGLGWAAGTIAGYITGKLTENKLSKNNKLY